MSVLKLAFACPPFTLSGFPLIFLSAFLCWRILVSFRIWGRQSTIGYPCSYILLLPLIVTFVDSSQRRAGDPCAPLLQALHFLSFCNNSSESQKEVKASLLMILQPNTSCPTSLLSRLPVWSLGAQLKRSLFWSSLVLLQDRCVARWLRYPMLCGTLIGMGGDTNLREGREGFQVQV
ncbi:hypothetical protein C8J57DRAFT_1354720 [Mycena rebaudengoi]|nr:hypothetical protein C8J57DRAFT_1354720 [Mycena rebaudengoi]